MVIFLSGCGSPVVKHSKQRFFWPPYKETAKIEYIGSYRSSDAIRDTKGQRFSDAVFGVAPPQLLFGRPQALAVSAGDVAFVSDVALRKVHVLNLSLHTHSFLRDVDNAEATFGLVMGLAVDAQNVYVIDSFYKKAQVFSLAGKFVKEFDLKELVRPIQITVDQNQGRIYIVDVGSHRIAVYDLDFELLFFIGERGARVGTFNYPLDVDTDNQGNLYVLDSMNCRIQVFSKDGKFVRAFGERGTAVGSFRLPKAIAVSAFGHVYVTDSLAHRFVVFDTQGEYLITIGGKSVGDGGRISPGGFYMPHGLDVDETGGIWVIDSLNRTLHKFQYLSEAYLSEHPISLEDVYFPGN